MRNNTMGKKRTHRQSSSTAKGGNNANNASNNNNPTPPLFMNNTGQTNAALARMVGVAAAASQGGSANFAISDNGQNAGINSQQQLLPPVALDQLHRIASTNDYQRFCELGLMGPRMKNQAHSSSNVQPKTGVGSRVYLEGLGELLGKQMKGSGGGRGGVPPGSEGIVSPSSLQGAGCGGDASGGGKAKSSSAANTSNTRAVFGPMPPPPLISGPSVSISSATFTASSSDGNNNTNNSNKGNASSSTIQLDSATLRSTFEAMAANLPPCNHPNAVDSNMTLQQMLNSIANQSSGAGGMGSTSFSFSTTSNSSSSSGGNIINANASGNRSTAGMSNTPMNADELQAMLQIFGELIAASNNVTKSNNDASASSSSSHQSGNPLMARNAMATFLLDQYAKSGKMPSVQQLVESVNASGGAGLPVASSASMQKLVDSVNASQQQQLQMQQHSQQQQQQQGAILDQNAMRQAAFTAGMNVAMQQQQRQETIHRQEKLDRQKSGKKGSKGSGASSTGSSNNNTMNSNQVFSMIFGGNKGNGPNPLPMGAVPPLPPPPGGWPPGASSAAAAAAVAAALNSSLAHSPNCECCAQNNNSAAGMPFPNPPNFPMPDGHPDFGSAAWLEYYDACLKEGGVTGGIAEFEEYVRSLPEAQVVSGLHASMPQDRPILGGSDCPAGFEYDGSGDREEDYEVTTDDEEQFAEIVRQQLEAEEEEKKARQAAKKRDKKARQKERLKKEAEAKAALAAKKKREKTITSWRSRVVAACSSKDATKMSALIAESPYRNYVYDPDLFEDDEDDDVKPVSHSDYLSKQMDWFLSNCLQKYPKNLELGQIPFKEDNPAREQLAKYIMSQSFDVMYTLNPSHGRSVLHTAAYSNDANLLEWILECRKEELKKVKNFDNDDLKDCIDALCDNSGWAPIHYATIRGCEAAVEALLKGGCNILVSTDPDMTFVER